MPNRFATLVAIRSALKSRTAFLAQGDGRLAIASALAQPLEHLSAVLRHSEANDYVAIIRAIAVAAYRLPSFVTCPCASNSAAMCRNERLRPLTG